jgi:hypothetical protein
MAGVMNELETNKQEWIKPELTAILISLEKKLERKILRDINEDFEKRLSDKGLSFATTDALKSTNSFEVSIASFMKDCLGLIKSLQYQRDINFDTSDFHRRILGWISQNFENKAEVMHEYSNTLIKMIQLLWNYKPRWQ